MTTDFAVVALTCIVVTLELGVIALAFMFAKHAKTSAKDYQEMATLAFMGRAAKNASELADAISTLEHNREYLRQAAATAAEPDDKVQKPAGTGKIRDQSGREWEIMS